MVNTRVTVTLPAEAVEALRQMGERDRPVPDVVVNPAPIGMRLAQMGLASELYGQQRLPVQPTGGLPVVPIELMQGEQ